MHILPHRARPTRLHHHVCRYDLQCFALAWLLFVLGVAMIALSHAGSEPSTAWALLWQQETWGSWRAAVTHYVFLRVFFPLSSAPFMAFLVPAVDVLLSRTAATGYDAEGRPVPLETQGLSAYVTWLEKFLESRAGRLYLSDAERARLAKAASQARGHLKAHPRERKEMITRRKGELDAVLSSVINSRSHPLYAAVFPDRLLCAQFEERLQAANQLGMPTCSKIPPQRWRFEDARFNACDHGGCGFTEWLCAYMVAPLCVVVMVAAPKLIKQQRAKAAKEDKYGVEWQADSTADGCSICDLKWTLVNRRHHCRACGRLVCDTCSRTRQTVVAADGSRRPSKRVCDDCVRLRTATAAPPPAP